jgi:hypothetical protein
MVIRCAALLGSAALALTGLLFGTGAVFMGLVLYNSPGPSLDDWRPVTFGERALGLTVWIGGGVTFFLYLMIGAVLLFLVARGRRSSAQVLSQ